MVGHSRCTWDKPDGVGQSDQAPRNAAKTTSATATAISRRFYGASFVSVTTYLRVLPEVVSATISLEMRLPRP